jgi:hypothetical protein
MLLIRCRCGVLASRDAGVFGGGRCIFCLPDFGQLLFRTTGSVLATYKAEEDVAAPSSCLGRGVGEQTKSRSGGQPRCGQEPSLRLAMILQAGRWYKARATELADADISRCRCRRCRFWYGVASLMLEGSIARRHEVLGGRNRREEGAGEDKVLLKPLCYS